MRILEVSIATNDTEHVGITNSRGTLWRIFGVTLLCVLVVSWFVWGPLGVFLYVGGLFNSVWVFILSPFLLLLIPAAIVFLPILAMRTIIRWFRFDTRGKWLHGGATAIVLAFVASFILQFVGLMPVPFDMFVRGFTRYIECQANVEGIRGWLATRDPNDYRAPDGVFVEKHLTEAEQPAAIARLDPKWAQPMLDEGGRLAVRLLWGGGFIGHWGIVVGRKDMPTPPSYPDERGEQRYPLAPGVYLWSTE